MQAQGCAIYTAKKEENILLSFPRVGNEAPTNRINVVRQSVAYLLYMRCCSITSSDAGIAEENQPNVKVSPLDCYGLVFYST
ncbi:hypothetical protein ANTPLA_LOCUS5639 [Anthophora plagiata]